MSTVGTRNAVIAVVALLVGAAVGIGVGAAIWSGDGDDIGVATAEAPPEAAGQAVDVSKTSASKTFEGDLARGKAGGGQLDCASGQYVLAADDGHRGTILDKPYLVTTGTDPVLSVGSSPKDSVEWGHIGSRLATSIEVGAYNPDRPRAPTRHYKITVYCTDNQSEAWVIFG